MARNSNYIDGIAALMQKYNLRAGRSRLRKLKQQLADYDAWMRATVLPKARTDFRLPPEQYALELENFGIDIPQAKLAAMAHQAFNEFQGEMKVHRRARLRKSATLPSSDYRDVIRELKKQQLVGDAILPFYENRLKQIEKIIVEHQIVTLPDRRGARYASPRPPRPRSSLRRTWCRRRSFTTPDSAANSFCR